MTKGMFFSLRESVPDGVITNHIQPNKSGPGALPAGKESPGVGLGLIDQGFSRGGDGAA